MKMLFTATMTWDTQLSPPLGCRLVMVGATAEVGGSESGRHHRQKKNRIFGHAKSFDETTIEAVRHPSTNECWHEEDRWTLIQAAPWKNTSEHISIKEGRVLLIGLHRWAQVSSNVGKTVFHLLTTWFLCFALRREGPIPLV